MFFEFISFGKFKKEYLIHYLYRENYYDKMINSFLKGQISHNFPYNPTSDQRAALETIADFLL